MMVEVGGNCELQEDTVELQSLAELQGSLEQSVVHGKG